LKNASLVITPIAVSQSPEHSEGEAKQSHNFSIIQMITTALHTLINIDNKKGRLLRKFIEICP